MAVKKVQRPARAGAPKPVTDSVVDEDTIEDDEQEETEEETDTDEFGELEVAKRRLVAPRVQGITKFLFGSVEEMSIVTFFSKNPEQELCTVDSTNMEEEKIVVTVLPHPWATELAIDIYDSLEVDAIDPNTITPETDGWVAVIEASF